MTLVFEVEEAGCESCAALVRGALEPLATVESVEVDEAADRATVRLGAGYTVAIDTDFLTEARTLLGADAIL